MRSRRLQLTIAGILGIVALIAVLLGCFVEVYRIRRTQAFYRQEAANYAQLEKGEERKRSEHLRTALLLKERIEYLELHPRAGVQDHFVFPFPADLDASYTDFCLNRGREELVRAAEARANAQRFSKLRQRYHEAGTCLWLPFGPNPLKVKK
jgi:hypothetical protein